MPRRTVIGVIVAAVIVVAVVIVIVVVQLTKSPSTPALDLTGKWVAQYTIQGFSGTANLTLAGTNSNLHGRLTASDAPFPIDIPVTAHVVGTTAYARLSYQGATYTAQCAASNTRMDCSGTGRSKGTLSLTFRRPS